MWGSQQLSSLLAGNRAQQVNCAAQCLPSQGIGLSQQGRKSILKSSMMLLGMQSVTKLYNEYWYIDSDRDFHYYYSDSKIQAPLSID